MIVRASLQSVRGENFGPARANDHKETHMRRTLLLSSLTAAAFLAASCASEAPVPEAPPYRIVASTEELMYGIVIPNAEVVFESVGSIIDETGINDFQPETDEEWEEVADRALGLAESANLLIMPERSEGREVWIETSLLMSERAVRVSETALLRDRDALLEAGGELYEACEACHMEYAVEADVP